MTAAQKKAKDNFKKAIAYRKKTGCTLKQAFSHVYGKKTVGAIKKKTAPKKKAVTKKKAAVKKKAAPKRKTGSYHKDTQSHNVKISVVSGIKTSTQAGAILNVFIKRSLRAAGHSVPNEISTNVLKKIYKTIFGKKAPDLSRIKRLLKKHGYWNATAVFQDLNK